MTGMPAEASARAIRSFIAWCLADLPGLVYRQRYGHVRQPVSRNSMDAGHTVASPVSRRQKSLPPRRQASGRKTRSARRKANRCYYYYFDRDTKFPANEKITLCNTKKVQKSSWNEPYSSSSSSFINCHVVIVRQCVLYLTNMTKYIE